MSDLDRAGQYLFPQLSPVERRAKIDRALADAEDPKRVERIEELAGRPDLFPHLLDALRLLIEEHQEEHGEEEEDSITP